MTRSSASDRPATVPGGVRRTGSGMRGTRREDDPKAVETVGVFLHRFFATDRARVLGRIALTRPILREERFLYQPPVAPTGFGKIGVPVPDDVVDAIRHVADWIEADVRRGASWLERLDTDGRPPKLAKLTTLAQAVNEADKAMRRRGTPEHEGDRDEGERLETSLEDGWSVVRLLTPDALDHESVRMRHCVGHGAYDQSVASGSVRIHSLRDPDGRPHLTIEILSGPPPKLRQMLGRRNAAPDEILASRVKPWLGSMGIEYRPGSTAEAYIADFLRTMMEDDEA